MKKKKNTEKSDIKKEKPDTITKRIEFGKGGIRNSDILENDSENEEEKEIKESEKIYSKKTDTIIEVKEEVINKLKSISNEEATKAIVKRMLKNIIDSNLKLNDTFPEFKSDIYGDRENILKKSSNRKEGEDYVDKRLFCLFNDLSKNLFIKLYQQCINFDKNEICAVIAIDLCRIIDKKFKLFHTIIANAMAHCFNSIEIPYSIVVFL